MHQLGFQHLQSINETFSMGDIMPAVELKLPFLCKNQFFHPCRSNSRGFYINACPHEKDAAKRFYVIHVNLVDAAQPCTKAEPEANDIAWQSVVCC